jgi:hypothetical protein
VATMLGMYGLIVASVLTLKRTNHRQHRAEPTERLLELAGAAKAPN